MPLILGMLSLCALVFGATLAQLGLVTPVQGLAISLASLPLSLISIGVALFSGVKNGRLAIVFSSVLAWPAPLLLGPPVARAALVHFKVRTIDSGPVRINGEADDVFAAAIEAVKSQKDWRVKNIDARRREFDAVALSRVFQFRHEFSVRVKSDGARSLVEWRDRTLPGKYDFAGNRERAARFLASLTHSVI